MSKYTVLFRDTGVFVGRDAHWFKVTLFRDGVSLGTALGVIDGRSWDEELLGAGGAQVMSKAAVRLLAIALQDAVEAGELRDTWEVGAVEFALTARNARHLVDTGVAQAESFEPDAAVAFFEH